MAVSRDAKPCAGLAKNGNMKRILFEKLRSIYPNRDFVTGVISNAETRENFQHIIDFIDRGEDVTAENITALSILLSYADGK